MGFFRFFIGIGIFVVLFNAVLNRNGMTVLFTIYTNNEHIGDIPFTLETLMYSIISIMRLMIIIFSFSLGNFIINLDDLLRSLMKLKLPYVFSLLITMSLRFFPLMLLDLDMVSEVQKARGLQIDTGNWITKIKNRVSLLLPLLSNSLDRAVEIAEALESKGFGRTNKRTSYKTISTKFGDYLQILLFLSITIIAIWTFIMGYGTYQIYPLFYLPKVELTDIILLFGFTIIILIYSMSMKKEDRTK